MECSCVDDRGRTKFLIQSGAQAELGNCGWEELWHNDIKGWEINKLLHDICFTVQMLDDEVQSKVKCTDIQTTQGLHRGQLLILDGSW